MKPQPALFLLAIAALALAAGASATPPRIGTFQTNETYVDDGATAACGFPVTVNDTTTGHFQVLFDNTGTPIRVDVEEHVTGTFTANGLTVDTAGDTLARFDLVNGTETDAGINIRVSLPAGGILYLDRGRLVFDSDGNLVSESGHHPSLHGDFAGLCAALTP